MPIVYMAVNRINGKRYIGVTSKTLEQRCYGHFWAAKNGSKMVFASAIRKYGPDAFEFSVLETFDDILDALVAERSMIAERKPEYNVAAGGVGPSGVKWSAQRRERMIVSLTASWTDERKKLMSETARKNLTPERIQKLKDARPPDLGCREVVCLNTGEKFKGLKYAAAYYGVREKSISSQLSGSQTATKGLSFAFASDVPDEAVRVRLLRALDDRRNGFTARRREGLRNRPVRCLNNGKVYSSGHDAAKAFGISKKTISNLCRLGGATQGGLKFMFADADCAPVKQKRTEQQIAAQKAASLAALQRGVLTNSKKVRCVDTGETFQSLSEAARSIGARASMITDAMQRSGRCHGLRFCWAEDQR